MASETQEHILTHGTMEITRNGRHQYTIDGGPWQPSVSTMNKYIAGDTFGVGANWAAKLIRESGDMDAVKNSNRQVVAEGNQLHEQINKYIQQGVVAENPVFVAWLAAMQRVEFLASERFVYHPQLLYGGTFDAVGIDPDHGLTLYDWKTRQRDSFEKAGSIPRLAEQAQLAAYAHALWEMDSVWQPIRAVICYIMRDGSYAVEREIDIDQGMRLFEASRNMHSLVKEAQARNTLLPRGRVVRELLGSQILG